MKYNQYLFFLLMLLAFNPSNAQVSFGFPDLAPPSTVIGTQATHDNERWNDFQDYADHPLYGILGKSVGQLAIYYSGSPYPYVCTGTLISERYVITNYHCVYPTKEYQGREVSIANIRMYMNYHRPNTGRDATEVKEFALFSSPVEYSADFDYAILEVAGSSPASEFGYVPVRFGDYSSSDSLFIIHHSADPSFGNSMSDHKRITFRDCQTLNFSDIGTIPVSMPDGKSQRAAVEGRDVPHFCDTTGGSSGSLVFNANGDIVGLHFAGLRNKDAPENSRFNLFINIRAILSQSHKLREIGYVADATPATPTPPTPTAPTPPAPTPPAPTPPAPTVQRGYISISSSPSGATVALDGRVIGSTPLQNYAYDAGDYQLSLRYNGYQTYSESIRISANSLFQRSINLRAEAPAPTPVAPVRPPSQPSAALITTSEELVRRAAQGGRLELAAVTFRLRAPLELRGDVQLIGQGYERTRIVSSAREAVVRYRGGGTFTARGVGFERDGGEGDVVHVADGNVAMDACQFMGGVRINDNYRGAGIVLKGNSRGTIRNSQVKDNNYGIRYTDSATGSAVGNEIFSNDWGITLRNDAKPQLEQNRIYENESSGILYTGSAAGSAVGNEIFSNNSNGIYVWNDAKPQLEQNRIYENESSGILYKDSAAGNAVGNEIFSNRYNGIDVWNDAKPQLEQNRIYDNQASGISYGYHNDAPAGSASNNQIYNNTEGITLLYFAHPTLRNNTFYGNREGAILDER